MSLISDFDLAWKSYEDKLASYTAQNVMNHKLTDADDFNHHFQRTIRMWEDESKAQGGFVTKWENACSGFRKKIISILIPIDLSLPAILKRRHLFPISGLRWL